MMLVLEIVKVLIDSISKIKIYTAELFLLMRDVREKIIGKIHEKKRDQRLTQR